MSLLITGCTQGVPELPDFDLHFDVEVEEFPDPTPDPDEITTMTEQIITAEKQLSDMTFFEKDPDSYQRLAEQTKQNKVILQEKEEAWLELEMLREELNRT